MKLVGILTLFSITCAMAQVPTTRIRNDSVPSVFPPDLMPNVLPNNSFYRHPMDPKNVVRATLDNMPIKVPDSSTSYTIQLKNLDTKKLYYWNPGTQPIPKKRR
ncbi:MULTISPECIES: hypothetical protein [unclassified Spirosoma]|uniref:hypothetical protein n=1 Tax=unclassified Spirosoma TaxID=2621999 RepID=UPI00095DC0FA|nr:MULTISPECIES: hypothetical protein [unclassified Spirosoma]MBN8825558.1 hypothetical protein [Spirosoma sp.]OJW74194.1 MAG: hypothetical protein BGO59_13830 [Spirosoma sp. 48-14]